MHGFSLISYLCIVLRAFLVCQGDSGGSPFCQPSNWYNNNEHVIFHYEIVDKRLHATMKMPSIL